MTSSLLSPGNGAAIPVHRPIFTTPYAERPPVQGESAWRITAQRLADATGEKVVLFASGSPGAFGFGCLVARLYLHRKTRSYPVAEFAPIRGDDRLARRGAL